MGPVGYCSSPEVWAKLTQAALDGAAKAAKAQARKERRTFVADTAARVLASTHEEFKHTGHADALDIWAHCAVGDAVRLAEHLERQGQAPWTADGKEIPQ